MQAVFGPWDRSRYDLAHRVSSENSHKVPIRRAWHSLNQFQFLCKIEQFLVLKENSFHGPRFSYHLWLQEIKFEDIRA